MKELILLGSLFLCSLQTLAQTESGTTRDTVGVNSKVEKQAEFIQVVGENKYSFNKFLERNLRFPKEWQDSLVKMKIKNSTKVITVKFIVCTDGEVCEITTNEDAPISLAKEAIRIIKRSSGNWKPGIANGKVVKTMHEQKINFVTFDD